eukprot:TRINITY_DN781945_c0_g1_i1.p1 TRINITY_DN781945_c0_g1~~TRINITY_DN781945_c0_g1_i1.p1  ORF type:complete len:554 (-),score=178.70 TRINITY_DN781945_c0_g1_i1:141-1802(-)
MLSRFSRVAHKSFRAFSGFTYQTQFPKVFADETEYRNVGTEGITTVNVEGEEFLKVDGSVLTKAATEAYTDIQHLFRPTHLQYLRNILDDDSASTNDKFVALDLLKNAVIAADMVLPTCQDTGTAVVIGKKGHQVLTDGDDEVHLSKGVYDVYTERNLRYSQMAPLNMYDEVNTKCNLPAQLDINVAKGNEFELSFLAKGGGSANKTFLFQETKALLTPEKIKEFVKEKVKLLGTAACPPYHLAFVFGGLSADQNLKTVKLASMRHLDQLPTEGNEFGQAFRDVEMEQTILDITRELGIGAQYGGKYFCHDVRVIRLPRHGASCPIGMGVSCSADRQIKTKITPEGLFVEQLETDPAKYLQDFAESQVSGEAVEIDLNRPMAEIRETLSQLPVKTRVSLNGPIVVARDIAHAKLKERIDNGEGLPEYVKDHIIYYAGPAKTPEGEASGSFGPTTAGRMDSYVDLFNKNGGSFITLAKGNRSQQVTDACKNNGGFYLGSIGGSAASLAQKCIKKVDLIEYPELGMEAIYKIEVENFPAFILVDDKGNDFFDGLL